jgi:hypothetical protein
MFDTDAAEGCPCKEQVVFFYALSSKEKVHPQLTM